MAGHDVTAETLADYLAKQAHKDTLRFITCGLLMMANRP